MADIIQIGSVSIYQDIELSLTEHLVPPVVHVKQFDHKSRKVRCTLYVNAVEYTIPQDAILAYSGTRPDGRLLRSVKERMRRFDSRKTSMSILRRKRKPFTGAQFRT